MAGVSRKLGLRLGAIAGVLLLFGGPVVMWLSYGRVFHVWSNEVVNDGLILVGSPAVYTRQRLVNDRLSQSAWLESQLKVTAQPQSQLFRSLDATRLERGADTSAMQVRVAIGRESQVNREPEIDRGVAGAGSGPTSPQPDQPTLANIAIEPSTADQFRAMNTYRDEVRSEMMQTQLDDRHDILGNTIYRLGFDATLLAGTHKNSLAIIKVSLRHNDDKYDTLGDLGCNKLKYGGDVIPGQDEGCRYYLDYEALYTEWAEHMQNVIADGLDLRATSIMQRRFDRLEKGDLTRFLTTRMCVVTFQDENGCTGKPKQIEFSALILQTAIRIQLDHLAVSGKKIYDSSISDVKIKYSMDDPEIELLQKAGCGPLSGRDFDYQLKDPNDREKVRSVKIPCPVPIVGDEDGLIAALAMLQGSVFDPKPTERDEALAALVPRGYAEVARYIVEHYAQNNNDISNIKCMVAEYTKDKFAPVYPKGHKISPRELSYYLHISLEGREINQCVLTVKKIPVPDKAEVYACDGLSVDECTDPVARMRRQLNTQIEVFSYSVTPKNLAQRVSTSSEMRNAMRLALRPEIASGGTRAEQLMEEMRDRERDLHLVESRAIVVGFGSTNGMATQLQGDDRAGLAQAPPRATRSLRELGFGWAIAPQLITAETSGKSEFAQIDAQYSLSAVISIPSWWRSVYVETETCWRDRSALTTETFEPGLCPDGARKTTQVDLVRLPGAISELSRKLGFDVVQQPYLLPTQLPQALVAGLPGQLVLAGGRLWRSTTVTIGPQQADEIIVLPDMEGIIAKFNCVQPVRPSSGNPNGDLALAQVWTSEGATLPLPVYINRFQSALDNGAEAVRPCYLDILNDSGIRNAGPHSASPDHDLSQEQTRPYGDQRGEIGRGRTELDNDPRTARLKSENVEGSTMSRPRTDEEKREDPPRVKAAQNSSRSTSAPEAPSREALPHIKPEAEANPTNAKETLRRTSSPSVDKATSRTKAERPHSDDAPGATER